MIPLEINQKEKVSNEFPLEVGNQLFGFKLLFEILSHRMLSNWITIGLNWSIFQFLLFRQRIWKLLKANALFHCFLNNYSAARIPCLHIPHTPNFFFLVDISYTVFLVLWIPCPNSSVSTGIRNMCCTVINFNHCLKSIFVPNGTDFFFLS